MNPIIALQKRYGSIPTKIKAIGFEIEKLEDEVSYNQRLSDDAVNLIDIQFFDKVVNHFKLQIAYKHLQIERLVRNG